MASELGQLIRDTRLQQGMKLREFARRIEKSPAFVTQLECEAELPSVAEDTLRRVAEELGLELGRLFVLAQRTPRDMTPASETEYALFRKVKSLSERRKQALLDELNERKR